LEKTRGSWVAWRPLEEEQVSEVLTRLAERAPQFVDGTDLAGARCSELAFYDHHVLFDLRFESEPEHVFGLHGPDETYWLDGTSAAIHDTNEAEELELTDDIVHDYVRFFLYFVRGDSGPFVLIESQGRLALADGSESDGDASELQTREATIRGRITPLTTSSTDESGRWIVNGAVAYDNAFFAATLAVAANGEVEMIDDEPVGTLDGLRVPDYLSLEIPAEASAPSSDEVIEEATEGSEDLLRDRDVTQAIVAVLLEGAFRERDSSADDSHTLLGHFNTETSGGTPIERLAGLVSRSTPVMIIESDIPFVEDFVAGLIDGPTQAVTGGAIARAGALNIDEIRCLVDPTNSAVKLHLISFHAYRGVYDVERTAHELALGDAAVLIGCDRSTDVPEPLRRIADLVLTFPRIDRKRFARIFERVFHAKPTPGWDAPGADWTRYLVPADFHAPRRMKLSPDDALRFLAERVKARLAAVTPDVGPRLDQLEGMGEARQICEDLMTDIRAAQAGEIPWSSVDKGMLLVGDPGTGKTTLARALAKECGIKFIVASAAGWSSAGALDSHLRAMRDDFAEARRYAPAILFIDEIDSIGSREAFTGHNASYSTQVVNALLEQIQGISTVDPVIVIGATNYAEKVDPALRRSGRLDQIVRLPRPNIAALEKIFEYYLEEHRADKQVAPDVETRTLAELAWGLTGADVERFVRGSARRARRAGGKIKQEHLVAEITQRPRRPDSAPRLGKEEIKRVAVHEAGHTVARLLSSTQGKDLTYVTIVPRMDGSLGFVATAPLDGHVLTRRTLLERLETILAGRAAEEIVFGSDDVGAGAGGSSEDSDLAVATRLAELVVCQSGLGDDDDLHWTSEPTPAQEKQIRALLGKAYGNIVARLEDRRELLDRIVEILEQKQELSGTELRQLLAKEERRVPAPVAS
jgi:AAA+ superfamily predicted ATPase